MSVKDNFSDIAGSYAAWRPEYPDELFTFLSSLSAQHNKALDCGTGNGQAAKQLAKFYKEVFATDISEAQLNQAVAAANIFYSVGPAEKTGFPDGYFDMLCAAQAAHWFNHELFYKEVERILKPGGVLALTGYGLIEINEEIDELIQMLYKDILGAYWDKERKYIDDHYKSLPFPYKEIAAPSFQIKCEWKLSQLIGYLNTWSALGHYKKMNNTHPLKEIFPALQKAWGGDEIIKQVRFPVITKIAFL
ncbi:MAG: class I SAM-dependent methyltransferase [Ferruginibacter sp.]|nr:class I SAM-dependent methyltransferase [Ferruginibacter sp.]